MEDDRIARMYYEKASACMMPLELRYCIPLNCNQKADMYSFHKRASPELVHRTSDIDVTEGEDRALKHVLVQSRLLAQ